jgi:hypothetical protein
MLMFSLSISKFSPIFGQPRLRAEMAGIPFIFGKDVLIG